MKPESQSSSTYRSRFNLALLCFAIAALAGCVLRYIFVDTVPGANYRYIMHGHSHLAMLGWVFAALFLFFIYRLLDLSVVQKERYFRLYLLLQVLSLVMFVSFVFTGYKTLSIILSTAHLLLTYVFAFRFLRDSSADKKRIAVKLARASVWLMVLSSVGVWGLGATIGMGLKGSKLYYGAVQFFLHFQFNGWFILAAIALLFSYLKIDEGRSRKFASRFYVLALLSVFLTFAQAVSWSNPLKIIFYINSLGVVVQTAALIYFLLIIREQRTLLFEIFEFRTAWLLRMAIFSLCLKVLTQLIVVVPEMAMLSYTIRNFIIGFIHLINLAFLSLLFFAFASRAGWLDLDRILTRLGAQLVLLGIFLTEFALFGQGILIWQRMGFVEHYYMLIFIFSLILFIGLVLMLLDQYSTKDQIGVSRA